MASDGAKNGRVVYVVVITNHANCEWKNRPHDVFGGEPLLFTDRDRAMSSLRFWAWHFPNLTLAVEEWQVCEDVGVVGDQYDRLPAGEAVWDITSIDDN
jgi:hypothetical protein